MCWANCNVIYSILESCADPLPSLQVHELLARQPQQPQTSDICSGLRGIRQRREHEFLRDILKVVERESSLASAYSVLLDIRQSPLQ